MPSLSELREQLSEQVTAIAAHRRATRACRRTIRTYVMLMQARIAGGESTGNVLRDFVTLNYSPAEPEFDHILVALSGAVQSFSPHMTPGAPVLLVHTETFPEKCSVQFKHFRYRVRNMFFGTIITGDETVLDAEHKLLDFPHDHEYVSFERGTYDTSSFREGLAQKLGQSGSITSQRRNPGQQYFSALLDNFVATVYLRKGSPYGPPPIHWQAYVGIASVADHVFDESKRGRRNRALDAFLVAAYGQEQANAIQVAHQIAM